MARAAASGQCPPPSGAPLLSPIPALQPGGPSAVGSSTDPRGVTHTRRWPSLFRGSLSFRGLLGGPLIPPTPSSGLPSSFPCGFFNQGCPWRECFCGELAIRAAGQGVGGWAGKEEAGRALPSQEPAASPAGLASPLGLPCAVFPLIRVFPPTPPRRLHLGAALATASSPCTAAYPKLSVLNPPTPLQNRELLEATGSLEKFDPSIYR